MNKEEMIMNNMDLKKHVTKLILNEAIYHLMSFLKDISLVIDDLSSMKGSQIEIDDECLWKMVDEVANELIEGEYINRIYTIEDVLEYSKEKIIDAIKEKMEIEKSFSTKKEE